jgi:serine protease Do
MKLRMFGPLVSLAAVIVTQSSASAQNVAELFQKVNASVVVIKAKGRDVSAGTGQVLFSEIGSGVLISPDGRVMTAAHVVQAMDEITVELLGGETVAAHVIASEPAADLSLLQLRHVPKGALVAPMANSDGVKIGDQVAIIGAPYGLRHSMTVGWISARWAPNTVYPSMPLAEFFQTDAVINTGNSGSPMFSLAGQVIGIVSHNISKSGGSEGLGFVVTINTAKKLLLEQPSFWSGLEGRLLTNELADLLNLPPKTLGYLVKTVAKGSPGEATGLRGDEGRGDRRRDDGPRRHHHSGAGHPNTRPRELREDPRRSRAAPSEQHLRGERAAHGTGDRAHGPEALRV